VPGGRFRCILNRRSIGGALATLVERNRLATQRQGIGWWIPVVAVACLAAPPAPARAQTSSPQFGKGNYFTIRPPGSVDYVITDKPVIIAAQVRFALSRESSARQMLAGYGDFDGLTAVNDVVHDGYVLLRTAQHGIERAQSNSKFPNPILAVRAQKIRAARDELLACMNFLGLAQTWQDTRYVAEASDKLDNAIELIEAMLPQML
jgi:hypothetical protein